MSQPLFSVIIVCGHGAESLHETLMALGKMPTPPDIEVIVLDGGRVEGRAKAVASASNRGMNVRRLELPDISKAAAWNVGVREASGDFLAFLDDDCIPPPHWLRAHQEALELWDIGFTGGPDRIPRDARTFERCLECVLGSFIGTLGIRSGSGRLSRYYPRPWNMAARREAVVLSGGFDETCPEAPEVLMISRGETIGFKALYYPSALIYHHRETSLEGLVSRDFRLGMARGMGALPPGLGRLYGAVSLVLLLLAGLYAYPMTRPAASPLLTYMGWGYVALLAASSLFLGVRTRSPIGMALVPVLMAMHHSAHITGYATGWLAGRLRRK